jgi:mono/diheme cytochrome c family protein
MKTANLLNTSYLVILLLLISCTKTNLGVASLYVPTSADVTANATLQELQDGRNLYTQHCNACHELYSPDQFTVTQWKSIISTMGPKTNMTAAQITLVTKYVSRGKQ